MSRIGVLVWGLGAMGLGVSEIIQEKSSLDIVAAVTRSPAKVGRDLGSLTNTSPTGIIVTNDIDKAFDKKPDVALICTSSFVPQVSSQIIHALNRGSNVITIAEEMAYPWISSPELSKKIHEVALANGKTVLGTGINPGFVLDILIIAMTGVCKKVDHIHGRRVNDLAPFGPTVMRTQGVGTTPEEFEKGLAAGDIVGHVGFPQSAALIASALGWDMDKVEEERQPIISNVERKTDYAHVMPGNVAGCRHVARAYSDGREVILLEHPQQIRPELEGVDTGDSIFIKGEPDIDLRIRPEIPGGIGTTALSVNMIPQVVNARPGLLTMVDFPVPRLVL